MKKIILLTVALFVTSLVFAQNSSRVEQYCQLIATPRLLSNEVTIDIDFGEEISFWKDNRLKDYDGKLKRFNTNIDTLNFMGKKAGFLSMLHRLLLAAPLFTTIRLKKLFPIPELR